MDLEGRTAILTKRRPELAQCVNQIKEAYKLIYQTSRTGGTIFTCGNGGSNSDSFHIVGELLKSFEKERPLEKEITRKINDLSTADATKLKQLQSGIKSMALGAQTAFVTAFSNDVDPDLIFGQELLSMGSDRDVLLCLSTSGNSANVKYAAIVAQLLGMHVILLTGQSDGLISKYADVIINVPETETYKVQELHISIYHCLCLALEDEIY